YGTRPLLMVVGQDDKTPALFEAGYVYQMAKKAAGDSNVTLLNVPHERGTKMLSRNRGLVDQIVGWIEHPIGPTGGVSVMGVSSDTAPGEPPVSGDPDSDLFPSDPEGLGLPPRTPPA